jgi:hypothetical protein
MVEDVVVKVIGFGFDEPVLLLYNTLPAYG